VPVDGEIKPSIGTRHPPRASPDGRQREQAPALHSGCPRVGGDTQTSREVCWLGDDLSSYQCKRVGSRGGALV